MKNILKYILHPTTIGLSVVISGLIYIVGINALLGFSKFLLVIAPIGLFFYGLDRLISWYSNWYRKTFEK